jgi:hypothetical protein
MKRSSILVPCLSKRTVTYVICSVALCFMIVHGNHLTSLWIEFRMHRECTLSQLSSKRIQPSHLFLQKECTQCFQRIRIQSVRRRILFQQQATFCYNTQHAYSPSNEPDVALRNSSVYLPRYNPKTALLAARSIANF